MVAFVVSALVVIVGTGAGLAAGRRRPRGTPLTWGEAMVGATLVFGLLIMAYGVTPNQWLSYADNELLWRPDRILLGVSSGGIEFGDAATTMAGSGRILVTYQTLRDVIATVIYGAFLTLHMVAWSKWQKRGKPRADVEPRTSRFGRPLLRRAAS